MVLLGNLAAVGKDVKHDPTTRRPTHLMMKLAFNFIITPLLIGLFLRSVTFCSERHIVSKVLRRNPAGLLV